MESVLILFRSKPIAYVIAVLLALISIYSLIVKKKSRTSDEDNYGKIRAPEPKGEWPIIGHLHLFRPTDLLYRKLGAMADELGPAFMIRLGMRPALVVSNCEIAKECFTTNDLIFATRPKLTAAKHMSYGCAGFGVAPYGTYWREVRKVVALELLSNYRLHLLKRIRISEIDMSIKELHELCMKKKGGGEHSWAEVDLCQWFKDVTLNIMVRLIAGKRYYGVAAAGNEVEESQRWKKANEELCRLFGLFVVADAIPWLEGLDVQGHEGAMKRTAKEMDAILSRWVEEHRMKKRHFNTTGDDEQDFIDVMLDRIKDDKISDHDVDTVVKSTCLSLVAAGSDTTTVALTWAVSLLLNNLSVLKKAQAELEHQIGKSRGIHVQEEDINKLPYLQAIVKETLRLYPPGPLSLPHEAMKDCNVAGFHVPKGTRLITNIWKLHRDAKVWVDPSEFRPERFLTVAHAHVDYRGLHYEFIPFGSGRRICPGISLASGIAHLTLARLLHEFELVTPSNAPVDMTEISGITLAKARPLKILVNPRLH